MEWKICSARETSLLTKSELLFEGLRAVFFDSDISRTENPLFKSLF